MSLLSRIANREILNFLRTTTLKNTYFADQSKHNDVREQYLENIPDVEIPYIRHIAGEYILKFAIDPDNPEHDQRFKVRDPMTRAIVKQTYKADSKIFDRNNDQFVRISNWQLYSHQYKYDEMMYVTSLDTGEEIPFTLENLHSEFAVAAGLSAHSVHVKTLKAYRIPGRYFNMLCERYPSQVDLIKAILYPTPARDFTADELASIESIPDYEPPSLSERRRERIAAAANFDILQYDDSLLEENERVYMCTQMKKFLDIVKLRWDIKEFAIEENYPLTQWAMVWALLPLVLISQRYANIKTPFVHSMHLWDYLTSKGLEEYKGYLTTEQALYLYKNIGYLSRHRGKQLVTNLLIDNILSEYNLDIHSKTIVLDTTRALEEPYEASSALNQCNECSRRHLCNKKITGYMCPEFLGLDHLCKATPVVLTEEFAGASEKKIIEALVRQFGYSEEEAELKYHRSFIWRDGEVEAVKLDLDRDQLVDLSGATESLEELIAREHTNGLEPIYNSGVVEEQKRLLYKVAGSYAPTKILEMTEKRESVRFQELFDRFFVETLLRLAPVVNDDGSITSRVNDSYKMFLKGSMGTVVFSFSELIALLYLGFTKERSIDFSRTRKFERTEDTSYDPNKIYFFTDSIVLSNGEQLYRMVTEHEVELLHRGMKPDGTSGAAGNPRECYWYELHSNRLVTNMFGATISEEAQQDLNSVTGGMFDFPIPSTAQVATAFKYGKPVLQQELIDGYADPTFSGTVTTFYHSLDQVTNRVPDTKILRIRDLEYAVAPSRNTKSGVPEDRWIWTEFSSLDYDPETDRYNPSYSQWATPLTILGVFTANGAYVENNGEIPIIPKYFHWYSSHLSDNKVLTKDEVVIDNKNYYVLDNKGEYTAAITSECRYFSDGGQLTYIPIKVGKNKSPEVVDETVEIVNRINPAALGWYEDPIQTVAVTKKKHRPWSRPVQVGTHTFSIPDEMYLSNEAIDIRDVPSPDDSDYDPITYTENYSVVNGNVTQKYLLSSQVDLNYILEHYVDAMDVLGRQTEVSHYVSEMFGILERLMTIANGSTSVKDQAAIQTLLNCMIVKKPIRFELTNTPKKTQFKTIVGANNTPILVATYQDWIDNDEDFESYVTSITSSSTQDIVWNEIGNSIVSMLLENVGLQYAGTSSNRARYNKLKKLVTSLCSYKINIVDYVEGDKTCDASSPTVVDDSAATLVDTTVDYFDPITDGCMCGHPRTVRPFESIYIMTSDPFPYEGKTYYKLVNTSRTCEPYSSGVDGDGKPIYVPNPEDTAATEERNIVDISYVEVDPSEYETIPFGLLYEKVNVGSLLGVPDTMQDRLELTLSHEGTQPIWNYRYGPVTTYAVERPSNLGDDDVVIMGDTFIESSLLTSKVRKLLAATRYVKYPHIKQVDWVEPTVSPSNYRPVLTKALANTVAGNIVVTTDKTEISILINTKDEPISVPPEEDDDQSNP